MSENDERNDRNERVIEFLALWVSARQVIASDTNKKHQMNESTKYKAKKVKKKEKQFKHHQHYLLLVVFFFSICSVLAFKMVKFPLLHHRSFAYC